VTAISRLSLALLLAVVGCDEDPEAPAWTPAFDAEPLGWFLNVGGASADALWAVGGTPDDGLMMGFDGTSWTEQPLPAEVPLLNWVHALAVDDVTVVGNGGTVLHFDGATWTSQETPTEEDLWGVWGVASDDLWAVGGRGREAGQATLLRFDGTEWSSVELPVLERPNVNALFKVWGSGPSDVWAVGQRGAVLHYDGSTWTEELVGASDDLIAVWGTGPDHVVAVGGRGVGIASVFDGTEWRTESLAPTPGLNGIWTRSAGTAHAVGVAGTLVTFDTTTFEVVPETSGAADDFHAVFSPPGSNTLYAVGGTLGFTSGPYEGLAYQRLLRDDE